MVVKEFFMKIIGCKNVCSGKYRTWSDVPTNPSKIMTRKECAVLGDGEHNFSHHSFPLNSFLMTWCPSGNFRRV